MSRNLTSASNSYRLSISLQAHWSAFAAFLGSTTGWVSKCGTRSYCDISTLLGSMSIIRKVSGVERINAEVTMLLIHELLPAPVAPAIKIWGIFDKFITIDLPFMSLPTPTSSG